MHLQRNSRNLVLCQAQYLSHRNCCVSIGEKGGGGWVIRSTFPTLGYEYTALSCVSTSCMDTLVGEIWPEVLLERNLATLSNHICSVRSSYACQVEVCSMGDLW